MGSLLGLALVNIFVRYCKEKLFSKKRKPPVYFRYVGDTFVIFDEEAEADGFLTTLNGLRSSLKFTFEKRKTNIYRFLMCRSKEQILALKPMSTRNLPSLASFYVGSLLVLINLN